MALIELLQMQVVESSPDHAEMTMPITDDILQPFGFLHGGATLSLLESVASEAAEARCDLSTQRPFGVGIHVRHRKAGRTGTVRAVAEFSHEEPHNVQVFKVAAYDEKGDVLSEGTFTTMIVSLEHLHEKGLV